MWLGAITPRSLSLSLSAEDEAKLWLWLDAITPRSLSLSLSAEDEAKLLLWWMELSQMWLRQLDYGGSPALCVNTAQRLVAVLHQLGEDRATTGFFGVIGFGKRSQLSLQ